MVFNLTFHYNFSILSRAFTILVILPYIIVIVNSLVLCAVY